MKKILVCITGKSPQVVTESIYALSQQTEIGTAWVPDEVAVITTLTGRDLIAKELLHSKSGKFRQLLEEYQLPSIKFSLDCVHVITDDQGQQLDDIRTALDNNAASNFILRVIQSLTNDPDTEIHVSIAGGRKTMGFFGGYALSLVGRPQDRLSHVLVSSPFESHPNFYFPSKNDQQLKILIDGESSSYNTKYANITLANIPFVRLRNALPERLLNKGVSFLDTVSAIRETLDPPSLTLFTTTRTIATATVMIKLPAAQFCLYAAIAYISKHNLPALEAPIKDVPDVTWSDNYLSVLRTIFGQFNIPDSVESAVSAGLSGNSWSQHLSKLKNRLQDRLGVNAHNYLVDDSSQRPRRYRLRLKPEQIHFTDR
jgi:CRISPR-associated protein (TIGR02584 family)